MTHQFPACTFVGDWFRVSPEISQVSIIQLGNVAWLSHLMAPAVGVSLNSPHIVMPSPDPAEFARQLDNRKILDRLYAEPVETWAKLFDPEDAGSDEEQNCFACLYEEIAPENLVIGFEIPPGMKRALSARGFDYISLHLHPIRFLSDLLFGAYTNSPAIAAMLEAIAFDPYEVDRQASRMAARFARINPIQARLPDGIPVLLGQTNVDSSLIRSGRFVQWQDYAEELSRLLADSDEIAFVRHPLVNWRTDVINFLRDDLGKTIIGVSGNTYAIMMSGRKLGPVLTLSSSAGVEAEVFGNDTHFLLADPRKKFAAPGLDNPVQIALDHRVFDPRFWSAILEGQPARAKVDNRGSNSLFLGANFVRGTLDGVPFFGLEKDQPFEPMEKIIIPSASATSERLDAIAGILTGSSCDRDGAVAAGKDNRIDFRFTPPPLAANTQWEWSSKTPIPELPFSKGIHNVEQNGVWLDGQQHTITLPLQGEDDLLLDCTMLFSFFTGIADERPAILIRADGVPVAGLIQTVENGHDRQLCWTMRAKPKQGPCQVSIECSHAASPHDASGEDDERLLAVFLQTFTVSARPTLNGEEGGSMRVLGVGDRPIEIAL